MAGAGERFAAYFTCPCWQGLGLGHSLRKRPPPLEPSPPPPNRETEASSSSTARPSSDGDAMSRRQQKKQVLRDARMERKGQKKVQKQADALQAALAALRAALEEPLPAEARSEEPERGPHEEALPPLLCSTFSTPACRYHDLPLAFGPSPSVGLATLSSVLIRPPKYGAKFLPQEYSLLHKIWALLGGRCVRAGVLDVGAGNANCAVLAASLLGLTVVCVERESPRVELRAEALLPPELQQRVIRFESDIADFGPETLAQVAAQHGLDRLVLVAKHPCGIGVDRSIDFAARLRSGVAKVEAHTIAPELTGAVIATCCTNKLSLDDHRVSRVAEFCDHYSSSFPTDRKLETAVEVMSRCSAWRTASESLGNAIGEDQIKWAELFEDHLQEVRLQRLRKVFGEAAEVRFAPRECTMQDRCLLAGAPDLPTGLLAASDDEAFLATLRQGSERFLQICGGPLDCRPKGLKSAKYDFDFTEDLSPRDP